MKKVRNFTSVWPALGGSIRSSIVMVNYISGILPLFNSGVNQMSYVCLRSYILEGELHYDNSITNQKRKFCPLPNCDSPIVDASEIGYSRDSFDEDTDLLSEVVDDNRRKVSIYA